MKTKLKPRAKHYLKIVGYTDEEISLIENSEYRYTFDYSGKLDEVSAIRRLGRETWLSGIARACFHGAVVKDCQRGSSVIYIERVI